MGESGKFVVFLVNPTAGLLPFSTLLLRHPVIPTDTEVMVVERLRSLDLAGKDVCEGRKKVSPPRFEFLNNFSRHFLKIRK